MPSNIEIVRQAFAAVQANDVEALILLLHEDVEFHSLTAKLAGRDAYLGHDGLREWDRDRNTIWHLEAETTGFEERDGRVLVDAHLRTVGGVSGVPLDTATTWVVDLRDGKIERIEGFTDRDEALAVFERA